MSASVPTVSFVIPCYNEVGTLRDLHAQIRAVCPERAEILFIDDGSNDGSREVLRALAAEDPACRVFFFRRNYGKAAALEIGFRAAQGEYIITMDADLQDDPAEIPRFLEALQTYDLVSGWKAIRHDPVGKTLPSKLFNATVRRVTGIPLHDMNCGFKGYRRAVIEELTVYGEFHRYLPALAAARGFTIGELVVTHHPRRSGVSKYGWERFIRGFLDLLTVTYLTKYRMRPLHLFGGLGIGIFLFSIVLCAVLSIPLNVMATPPRWQFFMWLFDASLFTMGPLLVAIGLIAEGQLANNVHRLPSPAIAERLNCVEATSSDEARHAG